MNTTAVAATAARELTPFERFRNYVTTTTFLSEVGALVGGEAQAKTFVRVVLTACQQTPRLLEADRRTLLLACMKAARDRLMPDGKEAVLNIYRTKMQLDGREQFVDAVQYLPMVHGLVKKLYDSGQVAFVDAAAVYVRDEFIYERGDAPKLVHRPSLADDPGEIVAAYAVIKLTNGETKREVMSRRDIEKVRASSKAPDGPGWKNWYDQFAIKSVIKRAYKQLPSSVELEQVVEADNEAIGFSDISASDAQPAAIAAINSAVKPAAIEAEPAAVTGEAPAPKAEPKARKHEPRKPDAEPPPLELDSSAPDISRATLIADVLKATNAEQLDAIADLLRSLPDETDRAAVDVEIRAKRKALAE